MGDVKPTCSFPNTRCMVELGMLAFAYIGRMHPKYMFRSPSLDEGFRRTPC